MSRVGAAGHTCHARGCRRACRPEHLMCRQHWAMVPADLQDAVWRTYRSGQCDDKRPSEAWHAAADAAIHAVAHAESDARGRAGTQLTFADLKDPA